MIGIPTPTRNMIFEPIFEQYIFSVLCNMQIEFEKLNAFNHKLKIIRTTKVSEETILDTKTYLLHDVCHYFVEKELRTSNGFWGMLSQGFQIEELLGKTNHLTEELRNIECIVGGIQSVYSKHMNEKDFWDYIQAIDYNVEDKKFPEKVVPRIYEFMSQWDYLPIGESIRLQW